MATRRISRRSWLRSSAALAGGLGGLGTAGAARALAAPGRRSAAALGAGEAVRLAFFGLRLRGRQHLESFGKVPGVRIAGLADPDRAVLEEARRRVSGRPEKATAVTDYRRLLDSRDIDAVVIASPDHWHAVQGVAACQAGKDVYVEKPVSVTIEEGRRLVAAARRHHRIAATGTQNRSDTGLRAALEWLREGHLGKMLRARGFDYPRRESIGKVDGPRSVPPSVDYDLYQGPAPLVPLRRETFHYDWHWFWPTATGDCGNRGVHTLDMIRWYLGERELPPRAVSIGGRFGRGDDGETPNTQVALFGYPAVPILWEMLTLPRKKGSKERESFEGLRTTMLIDCEGGRLDGRRGGARALDPKGKVIREFPGDSGRTHYANFVDAVRSRRSGDLRAEIREGHVSSALCHLANISWRTGFLRTPETIRRRVADRPLLAGGFERQLANLERNEIDLEREPITLGSALTIDPRSERFTGEASEWANLYLERVYRPPHVLPEVG